MDFYRLTIVSTIVYIVSGLNYTGTPYEYLGVSYNLLAGNPDEDPDPGFILHGRVFELTGEPPNVTEAVYLKQEPCQQQQQTVAINDIDDYKRELMSVVQLNRHNSNITAAAFTKSDDYHAMSLYLQSNSTCHLTTSCKRGISSLKTGQGGNELFVGNITKHFANDVCSLPMVMSPDNTEQYYRFLDRWGTSIVFRVDMGTRTVQSVGQPPSSKRSGTTVDYKRSSESDPISMALVPISYATSWIIWERSILQWVEEGICSTNYSLQANIATLTSNIETATEQYVKWIPYPLTTVTSTTRVVQTSSSSTARTTSLTTTAPSTALSTTSSVQTTSTRTHTSTTHHATVYQPPVTWPYGTYGLLETAHGCPSGGVRWLTGWRLFDTEDTNSDNAFSPGIRYYIEGDFATNDIKIYFCIKSQPRVSSSDKPWPKGNYCIFKVNTCPSGLHDGYIYWDDDDFSNHNKKDGKLPDGTYDDNTLIRFCCRNDASHLNEIELPTQRPFLLVQFGTRCQQVRGMRSRSEYIRWDNEDLFNKDENGGFHPYEDGGSKDTKLHFCYYQSVTDPGIIG